MRWGHPPCRAGSSAARSVYILAAAGAPDGCAATLWRLQVVRGADPHRCSWGGAVHPGLTDDTLTATPRARADTACRGKHTPRAVSTVRRSLWASPHPTRLRTCEAVQAELLRNVPRVASPPSRMRRREARHRRRRRCRTWGLCWVRTYACCRCVRAQPSPSPPYCSHICLGVPAAVDSTWVGNYTAVGMCSGGGSGITRAEV
jgi:hypothetical protein